MVKDTRGYNLKSKMVNLPLLAELAYKMVSYHGTNYCIQIHCNIKQKTICNKLNCHRKIVMIDGWQNFSNHASYLISLFKPKL